MLPRFRQLKGQVLRSSGAQRYAKNTSWLFSGHTLRLLVALIVSVALARYLGPDQFGIYNYVLSIVALVGVPAAMGLRR